MLNAMLRKLFPKDDTFKMLIEAEFRQDLRFAIELCLITSDESFDDCPLLNTLREEYEPNRYDVSHLYPYISQQLQQEYQDIHNTICLFLYRKPTDV